MKRVGNVLNKIEEWFLVIMMVSLSVVVFAQVFSRYVMGNSLKWSEELARYMTIWITFVGASYGFRYGAHIGVEAFKMWLPFRIRRCVDLLADVAVVVIACLMGYYGYSIIVNVHMKFGQVSPAMRMPIWIAYLAIPVGYALMVIRNIGLSINDVKDIIRGEELPSAEEAENGGNA